MDLGKRKKTIHVTEPIPAETYTMPKRTESPQKEVAAPVKERETVGVPK